MSNVVHLHSPKPPELFLRLWGPTFEASAKARDGSSDDRAEVLLSLSMIVGKAIAVMAESNKEVAQALLPLTSETIAEIAAESAEALATADELFGAAS